LQPRNLTLIVEFQSLKLIKNPTPQVLAKK